MKTMFKSALFLIVISLTAGGCSKDDNSPGGGASANLKSGQSWKVSYYLDSSRDETAKFSAYTFEFREDGVLNAMNSSGTVSGTWSISGNRFYISIGSGSPLEDITDDWLLVNQSENLIQMKDDNPSSAEELHFSLVQ